MVGVLEGLYAPYLLKNGGDEKIGGERKKEQGDGGNENERERARIGKLLRQAREELAIEKVFGGEWWGEGGWRYEVVGEGKGEGEVTWKEVVDQHPVVRKWERRVGEEVERRGVRRGVFEGREREGGRVEG